MPKVAYVHSPRVQIGYKSDNSATSFFPKRVDLPHIVSQIFDVAEIQD